MSTALPLKPVKIFCLFFIISLFAHGLLIFNLQIADGSLWASQAENIANNSVQRYDRMYEYTPIAPILYPAIVVHKLGFSYLSSLLLVLVTFDSLFIAASGMTAYFISSVTYWPLIAVLLLSFNHLYDYATPPSLLASLIAAFLFLYSVYIYKERKRGRQELLLLGAVLGLLFTIRAEVGVLFLISISAILYPILKTRKIILLWSIVLAVFLLLDPYMWTNPLRHLYTIFGQFIHFRSEVAYEAVSWLMTYKISVMALFGIIFMFFYFYFSKKIIDCLLLCRDSYVKQPSSAIFFAYSSWLAGDIAILFYLFF